MASLGEVKASFFKVNRLIYRYENKSYDKVGVIVPYYDNFSKNFYEGGFNRYRYAN